MGMPVVPTGWYAGPFIFLLQSEAGIGGAESAKKFIRIKQEVKS